MKHVFSIDVEDWYQGIELDFQDWPRYEQRVPTSMGAMLDLMDERGFHSTCFILGKVAEDHPDLIKDIHARGHEIATHGYSHEKVYNLTPDRFQRELRRSIQLLQDLTGAPILGHRAPYFSITQQSLWALDILAEEGIKYDSSIQPVHNYRYGIPDADRTPTVLNLSSGLQMLEVPVSTYPLPRLNLPVGGGAYLRIYPYPFLRTFLKRLDRRGEHIGIYMHPWEVDPDHPRLDLPFRVSATHYFNLSSSKPKLRRLFRDFDFAPYRVVFAEQLDQIQR